MAVGWVCEPQRFPRFSKVSEQSADDPRRTKYRPNAPRKWRFRLISADRVGRRGFSPIRRRAGRMAGPRAAEIFQDSMHILHNRPLIHEARDTARSPNLSGEFAEFRPIFRGVPLNFATSPNSRPDGGPAGRRDFPGRPGDSTRPHTDPWVLNSAMSLQVRGELADFLSIVFLRFSPHRCSACLVAHPRITAAAGRTGKTDAVSGRTNGDTATDKTSARRDQKPKR